MAKNHDHSTEIVSETKNGRIFQCKNCAQFCLEFGNLLLHFNGEQFEAFKEAVDTYDIEYFDQANAHLELRRPMIFGLGNSSAMMAFTADEIHEMRTLLDVAADSVQSNELHALYQDIENWLN